jgi:hypothetical protein
MVDANLGLVVSTDCRSISTDAYSKAVICNGLGRYEEARDAARWVVERDDLGLSGWALSELVEASTRTGQNGLATQAIASLRNRAYASGTDLAHGIESRASALLAEGEAADVHSKSQSNISVGPMSQSTWRDLILFTANGCDERVDGSMLDHNYAVL